MSNPRTGLKRAKGLSGPTRVIHLKWRFWDGAPMGHKNRRGTAFWSIKYRNYRRLHVDGKIQDNFQSSQNTGGNWHFTGNTGITGFRATPAKIKPRKNLIIFVAHKYGSLGWPPPFWVRISFYLSYFLFCSRFVLSLAISFFFCFIFGNFFFLLLCPLHFLFSFVLSLAFPFFLLFYL